MEYTTNPKSGDFYNLFTEYKTEQNRLDKRKIMDFLERKFRIFTAQDKTPKNAKKCYLRN